MKIITSEEVGSLNCNYLKLETANNNYDYSIQIIYKNQQFIYKQEQDTLFLRTKDQVSQLINELKSGLLVINDEEKGISIQNDQYTIFKNKGYTDNNFIVFANKPLTIKAPLNKFFTNQLITWLNSIEFGKG
ncbi:MAG: hypothetical protein ACR2IM_00905 [Sediminibacterium sp.]